MNKKNSIGVSQSKILINATMPLCQNSYRCHYATIPFQIKPWEYEEMKNPDEKVNMGAFCKCKKAVFSIGWRDYSPIHE